MNPQQTSFMSQITAARREAQELRRTMKDAACLATLTFPSLRPSHAKGQSRVSGEGHESHVMR